MLRVMARVQVWQAGLRARLFDDRGATAVEYALMLGLIFMVVFAAVAFLGQSTSSAFDSVKFTGP
jgi:pilus assembly protein Flp/PilA